MGNSQYWECRRLCYSPFKVIFRYYLQIIIYNIFSLSPDLNPDENVGAVIKGLVRSERPLITSEEDLINALRAAHERMCDVSWREFFIHLVQSMPRRLESVCEASGGHTKYQFLLNSCFLNKIRFDSFILLFNFI